MRSVFPLIALAGAFAIGALASSAVAKIIDRAQAETPAAVTASVSDVTRIKSGDLNCAHCEFAGADLSRQCLTNGNLEGANFDHAVARAMCLGFANLAGATFRDTDLSGSNLEHAKLDNADFTGARLTVANIRGADFSRAKGLIQRQLDLACGDSATKLPRGLHVNLCG
jgi:uncharacterized protein YjbI with pentapeptide repeats